jgi:hypothetical protein
MDLLWWYVNVTTKILNIIYSPVLHLKKQNGGQGIEFY